MNIIPGRVSDVSKSQKIQLLVSRAAQDVDGDEHRPYDEASKAAYHADDFQVSKEQVPIQRRMVQGRDVRHFIEGLDPIKPPRG